MPSSSRRYFDERDPACPEASRFLFRSDPSSLLRQQQKEKSCWQLPIFKHRKTRSCGWSVTKPSKQGSNPPSVAFLWVTNDIPSRRMKMNYGKALVLPLSYGHLKQIPCQFVSWGYSNVMPLHISPFDVVNTNADNCRILRARFRKQHIVAVDWKEHLLPRCRTR